MTSPVVTVPLEVTVFEGMAIMTRRHIGHLPVFKKSELVGIVTMGTLRAQSYPTKRFKIDQLMTYIDQK